MWSNILKWLDKNMLAIVFDCQEESFFFFFFLWWYNDLDRAYSQGFCLGTIFLGILNLTNPEKDL